MRGLLAILIIGLGTTVAAAGLPESIDDFIDLEVPRTGVPGVAYAVVTDDAITQVGAGGVVRLGGDTAVTADTPFLTGSISKSFTALAVMQLVEAGKVDLDTPVSHYMAEFANQPAGPITIRQLLSHTSGFSTLQGNSSHPDGSSDSEALARAVAGAALLAPAGPPGTRWEYSNLNYQILGRLIEVVSGQEFQGYVATHILQPVGMQHSFVADGDVHAAMATGHRPWFGTRSPMDPRGTHRLTAPQGGIVASARDLGRYMCVMLNGKDDILSASGKAMMMRPASDASPFYGFGWFLDSANGSVWHSGSSPGVETLLTMVPAERKGVVVLINAGSGTGFAGATSLFDGITAMALGSEYNGETSRWPQKTLFVSLTLMPIAFLLSIVWAWFHRHGLRAKSGAFGRFSLWFPLLTTLGIVWVVFFLLPTLFGLSIGTLCLFQPDLGLVLIASAATGVSWAVFRLALAYTGKPAPAPAPTATNVTPPAGS